jgi:hypothetical protein
MTSLIRLLASPMLKYAGIVGLVVALVFGYNHLANKYDKQGYERARTEYLEQVLKQEQQARVIEKSYQSKLSEAHNARTVAEKKILDISKSNNASIYGVRQQLNSFNLGLPRDSGATLAVRIETLSNVFSECIGAYSEVAEQADRHYQDYKLLKDAWPK